jgi:cell division protease FtsH
LDSSCQTARKVRVALFEGTDWQIYETMGGGRALVVLDRWRSTGWSAGLIDEGTLDAFQFGDRQLRAISMRAKPDALPGQRRRSLLTTSPRR